MHTTHIINAPATAAAIPCRRSFWANGLRLDAMGRRRARSPPYVMLSYLFLLVTQRRERHLYAFHNHQHHRRMRSSRTVIIPNVRSPPTWQPHAAMKSKPSGTFSHSSVLRSSSSPELQLPKVTTCLHPQQQTFCQSFGPRRARTLVIVHYTLNVRDVSSNESAGALFPAHQV